MNIYLGAGTLEVTDQSRSVLLWHCNVRVMLGYNIFETLPEKQLRIFRMPFQIFLR